MILTLHVTVECVPAQVTQGKGCLFMSMHMCVVCVHVCVFVCVYACVCMPIVCLCAVQLVMHVIAQALACSELSVLIIAKTNFSVLGSMKKSSIAQITADPLLRTSNSL